MTELVRPSALKPAGIAFVSVQDVPLNFQIGEWRAFSIRCRLAVVRCERAPTFAELPQLADARGYLLKDIPAPFDSKRMELPSGWFHRVLSEYPRHLVDLTAGYDAYMAKFSGKTRSTLKRKLRKFEELSGGAIVWREYRTPEELRAFFPMAHELSAKTYQERLLRAGLPDNPAFMRAALERASAGAVRAYLLFLNNRPVSYLYLPVENDRVIYAYLGYDPAVAEHSPGTVLQLLAMERLFADPNLKVFDFTEGTGQHKQLFSTHSLECADVMILRQTASMVVLATAHSAFMHTTDAIAGLLERMGLKRRVKMFLRALASARD